MRGSSIGELLRNVNFLLETHISILKLLGDLVMQPFSVALQNSRLAKKAGILHRLDCLYIDWNRGGYALRG